MRAAVDIMGGDHAPDAVLRGCFDAAPQLSGDDRVLLVGDEATARDGLAASGLTEDQQAFYEVVPATQVVAMDESPVEAIRGKPDSSIAVMAKLAATGGADVAISAGNTGACVAAAQLRMRTLPGVSRPGIAVVLPTFRGPVVVCDVGANPLPKPMHLHQYAVMASAYAQAVCGVEKPRVGLLSIGEEDSKGTTTVKATRDLLRDDSQIHFVGNVEGRDLFRGVVDVLVCDGFVGNTVLKTAEGMAEGLFGAVVAEMKASAPHLLAEVGPALKRVQAAHDYQETGGAPLLGVAGHLLICHGSSGPRAIVNAIRVGRQWLAGGINGTIADRLAGRGATNPTKGHESEGPKGGRVEA